MIDLKELLERIKAASGAERDLDGLIFVTLKLDPNLSNLAGHPGFVLDGSRNAFSVPAYTKSIDAALALVERVLPEHDWILGHTNSGLTIHCQLGPSKEHMEFGANPPLAILSALLTALIAQDEK